jgi:hypothetical protein
MQPFFTTGDGGTGAFCSSKRDNHELPNTCTSIFLTFLNWAIIAYTKNHEFGVFCMACNISRVHKRQENTSTLSSAEAKISRIILQPMAIMSASWIPHLDLSTWTKSLNTNLKSFVYKGPTKSFIDTSIAHLNDTSIAHSHRPLNP